MTSTRTVGEPRRRTLIPAAAHAAAIAAVVGALIVYWFGVADRYAVFLYDHLGAGPFDRVTTSRYWMASLVAGGMVACLHTPLQAFMGWWTRRRGGRYRGANPARVWALSAAPLVVLVPAVTMTVNAPTLSLGQAAGVTAALLAGLALALAPARWAAERPVDLAWLAADGLGLAPVLLLLLRVLELPAQGLLATPFAVAVAGGSLVAALAWLALMTLLRSWRHRPRHGATPILLAGLTISYLLLPLAHYLFATPSEYRYITTASNFFPESPLLLAASWVAAASLAIVAARLPRRHRR